MKSRKSAVMPYFSSSSALGWSASVALAVATPPMASGSCGAEQGWFAGAAQRKGLGRVVMSDAEQRGPRGSTVSVLVHCRVAGRCLRLLKAPAHRRASIDDEP